ncbi:MAG: TatD family hydrolase [Clostridia bacterium]
MIFDSHAHYDDERFDEDRPKLLSEVLPSKGVVGIINCASSFDSIQKTIDMSKNYPYVYGALGIHPECAKTLPQDYLEVIENGTKDDINIVAIGEIGLDYYYADLCPKDIQKEVFIAQLELAKKLDLPVIIHDRDAHGDMLEILKLYKPKGVVHCFSGSVEMANEIIKLGMYIGIGGVVTFKNAKHCPEVVKAIALDRLLLETDCPYLSPVPFRGKRNDSSLISYTADKIAEIKGITTEEVVFTTRNNVKDLFGV